MAGIGDEARIPVYINDEQAKSALKNLTQEAEKWRKKMYEAMAGGDMKGMKDAQTEVTALDKEAAKLKRTCFDVDKVLTNLSSASIRDIKKAIAELTREQNGLTRGTQEYVANQGRLQQLRTELRGINGDLTQQKGILDRLKSGAMELLPAFSFAAIAAAGVYAFNKIISATDNLQTKWEASMNGMNEGLNEFWRTVASGDWSNFTERIKEAIALGEKYIYTLDDIEDKTRSMSIIEAESRAKELDLEIKLRDKTLSKEERIKAGEERIKLEEDLSAKRASLAQETFDNEADLTAQQTKLSKDQLMGVMRDMDSSTKIKAKNYNDQVDMLDKLEKANVSTQSGFQGATTVTQLPATDQMMKLKIEIDSVSGATKVYGDQIRATGRTTDEQLDKMVGSYVNLLGAQNSAVENTKKVRTSVKSLLAGQEDTGQKIEDKAEKNSLEAVEAENKKKMDLINKDHLVNKSSEAQYNTKMLAQEYDFLTKKRDIYKKGSKEYEEANALISDKQVKTSEQVKTLLLQAEKELADAKIVNLKDGVEKEKAIEDNRWADELTGLKKRLTDITGTSAEEIALKKSINDIIEQNEKVHKEKMRILNSADNTEKLEKKHAKTKDVLTSADEFATSTPWLDSNQIESFFEARRDVLKTAYEEEMVLADGNFEKQKAALEKYNTEVIRLKRQEVDVTYDAAKRRIDIGQDFLGVLSGLVDKESALGKAIFLFQQGLAIASIWVSVAKANADALVLGPLAPAAIAANTNMGYMQTALVLAQTVANFVKPGGKKGKGHAEGGYTGPGGKYEEAGIVHKGEYVIPMEGVNNPSLRPMINMFEMARKNNSLARLDLRPVVQTVGTTGGYASGGYTSTSNGLPSYQSPGTDPELKAINKALAEELKHLRENGIKASINKYGINGLDESMNDISRFNSKIYKK